MVDWGRWGLPATALGRVRLAAMVYAVISAVTILPQIDGTLPAWRLALSLAGFAWLVGVFVITFVRARPVVGAPVITPLALVAAGASLPFAALTVVLCIATALAQSLYGGTPTAIVRLVAIEVAMLVAVSVSPAPADWRSAVVVSSLPDIALIVVLMRVLVNALNRQERSAVRARMLVDAGSRLIAPVDPDEIRGLARAAAADICRLTPGTAVLLLSVSSESVRVLEQAELPGIERGAELPAGELARLRDGPEDIGQIDTLDPIVGHRHWRAARVDILPEDWLLLVGGQRRPPDEVMDAIQVLATQLWQAVTRSRSHQVLDYQASHDSLTGLTNRRAFIERLDRALQASPAEAGIALIVADLDDFKLINDILGHAAGDQLLTSVAQRLEVIASDRPAAAGMTFTARLGGDEFALALVGPDREAVSAVADQVAQRIYEDLHRPVQVDGATVFPQVSIGSASGEPWFELGDLMRHADIAMYAAKARGKSQVDRYSAAVHGDLADVRGLEAYLGQAVERGEISVHYQPVVDIDHGTCVGVEALARWQHPTRGLIAPAAFIHLAERTGQITAIGAHVLRTACAQTAEWLHRPAMSELKVSVNLARRQLLDYTLARLVAQTLEQTGLPPSQLTLELTESEAIDDAVAIRQLREIAELGVRISFDDFGTGKTSLASLDRFPVHQIKIDRSFVSRDDPRTAAMLRLIIAVGQILGVEMVAEGVETREQAVAVRRAGVPLGQGYLFARPMAAPDFEHWFDEFTRPAPTRPRA